MINVIHTDVLKFIEHIFSVNSVIFECIHNFTFIIKLFLKNQYLFLYITIYYKFVYYFIISGAPNSAKFRGVAEGHPDSTKGGLQ